MSCPKRVESASRSWRAAHSFATRRCSRRRCAAPAAAALTHDAKAGTVLYLVSVGGAYFLVTDLSKHITVTKAQNALATDGALRLTGALFGLYGISLSADTDISASTVLIGGIGGSALGFRLGRGLTDAEAAMTSGSTLGGLTALGIAGTLGIAELENPERWVAASTLAGGVLGYFVGPVYPRSVRYTVTKSDIPVAGSRRIARRDDRRDPDREQRRRRLTVGERVVDGGRAGGPVGR